MEYSPILVPVVALVAWSLLIMMWMIATRLTAMRKAGISLSSAKPGSRGAQLDGILDDRTQWKSHNYNHLMEQPTLFYAIAITLALMDMGGGLNHWLAWGYVGFRVIHSLVQVTVNRLIYRTPLWVLASLCLVALTVHASIRILHDCGLI
ncbi:MAG TPA: MAPEG family protein [Sphingomicrobium sp.]|nr:MAPEG family protein [Sphingomicrobium sp.]